MKDQSIATVRGDEPIFRPPPQFRHSCSGQSLAQIHWQSSAQVGPSRFDAYDSSSLQHGRKATNGGFDFWKLRHVADDMAKRHQAR